MAEKQTIDFTQTKDAAGFNPKRKEEGEYLGTIVSFEDTKSKAGAAMWVFGVALKNDRRAIYPTYCLLGADQVWKLRNMMLAAGFKVPKKRITVDGNRLVGKDIGIFLEDDEYEGKPKSSINSFFPASEYSGPENGDDDSSEDDEYEEEETDVPEDDEEPEDDVPSEDEEEESDETDDSDSEDEDSEDETDEDEADEEDEPEDTPPPAKKVPAKKSAPAAAKKAPARAKAKPAPVEEDDDEMDVDDL